MNKTEFKKKTVAIYNHGRRKVEGAPIVARDELKIIRIAMLVLGFLIDTGMPKKPIWLWIIRRIPALAKLIKNIVDIIKE